MICPNFVLFDMLSLSHEWGSIMENRGEWNQFSGVRAEKHKIRDLDRECTGTAFITFDDSDDFGLFPADATNPLP